MEVRLTKTIVINGSVEMAGTVVKVNRELAAHIISSDEGVAANAPPTPEPQSIPTPKVKRVRKPRAKRINKDE